jgi:hypothetical protein
MTPFDPSKYPAPIAALWTVDRLPDLGPGRPNDAVKAILSALDVRDLFPNTPDREAAHACLSGLWLYHDFLDESHTISQDLPSWYGSYWHGIMHRREPDASNARYWFRRVETNPVYEQVLAEAEILGFAFRGQDWDPFAFVDQCERERGTGSDREMLCRRVQLRELQLLFDWCFRAAVSSRAS